MFNRWCLSQKVRKFDQLKELMLLEEFKNCVPTSVVTYLNEQKVSSLANAAVLADEYILTHRGSFGNRGNADHDKSNTSRNKWKTSVSDAVSTLLPLPSSSTPSQTGSGVSTSKKSEVVCFFCRKPGHKINDCSLYKRGKPAKPIGLINRVPSLVTQRRGGRCSSRNFVRLCQVNVHLLSILRSSLLVLYLCPVVLNVSQCAFCGTLGQLSHSFCMGFCHSLHRQLLVRMY